MPSLRDEEHEPKQERETPRNKGTTVRGHTIKAVAVPLPTMTPEMAEIATLAGDVIIKLVDKPVIAPESEAPIEIGDDEGVLSF